MNVEHTKQLLDGVISAGGSDELINALRSERDAKLTLITAEALLADGWRWDTQDREYTLTIEQRWTLYYDIEYSCLQVHCWEWESSVVVRGLSNMYDLRELVRILWGSQ